MKRTIILSVVLHLRPVPSVIRTYSFDILAYIKWIKRNALKNWYYKQFLADRSLAVVLMIRCVVRLSPVVCLSETLCTVAKR